MMLLYSNVNINGYFDSKTISTIKNLAFFFMLIDHIGIILYPEILTFRVIGRFAFPMFAFLTIYNFTFNVKDKNDQLLVLLILALLSQLVYIVSFEHGTQNLNIFFSLLLICFFITILENAYSKLLIYFSSIVVLFASFSVEYGFFGFMFMLFIYAFMRIDSSKFMFFMILFTSLFVNGFDFSIYSIVALLTVVFLLLIYTNKIEFHLFSYRFDKYLYYMFYPVHLLILLFISNFESINKFISYFTF